ncbi:MAG: hypothetical protein CFE44_03715 [Burkholderiales bacterium PBB4]|nr:MAG: hypothetical protein CFE44_03715 [Burkholderiales bacterium PBB4]
MMQDLYSSNPQQTARRCDIPTPGGAYWSATDHKDATTRLGAWFAGELALSRAEAHRLLEQAVESGRLTHHRAEFVAAVKALAAGPKSWHAMGYRLLPDD